MEQGDPAVGPNFGWYCYPWNVHDPAAVLADMHDTGMSHVTIAASYHAGKFIQPRDPHARVYFPEDGAVYFDFSPERYGRLKPVKAAITQERDVLREMCDAGRMGVRAWTVLNHNSRLGWLHPEVVARNAWGDPDYYSLCPANRHVQEYAVALCADMASGYALESLLLETPGWLTYDHGYHHEFAQVKASAQAQALLGLCFCDSCAAGGREAGLDIDGLRRAVMRAGDAALAGDASADAGMQADLAAFHDWRCSVVSALCACIHDEVRPEVKVRVISTCQRPHSTTCLEGGDLIAMDAATDGLELPIYQPSAEDAAADLSYVLGKVPDRERTSVILRPGLPDMTSDVQFADTLGRVLAAGIRDVSFYNYGMLPRENLGWVANAVRAVREGSYDG